MLKEDLCKYGFLQRKKSLNPYFNGTCSKSHLNIIKMGKLLKLS